MKLVITTQYMENYAAFEMDYVHGVSDDCWKMKGGSNYVMDFNFAKDCPTGDLTSLVEIVSSMVENENEASRTYVIDWEAVGDGEFAERWHWVDGRLTSKGER